jgi:hypothetical protein
MPAKRPGSRRFSALFAFPAAAFLIVLAGAWLSACMQQVAGGGGGTETESKVAGLAIDEEGNASVGARVILRPADYLADPVSIEEPSKRRQETITDARGRYVLKGIPAGYYRIEIAGTESGGAIRDFSLAHDSESVQLAADTVNPRGSIVGAFAPDSEAQLASFVQVFGMERLVKADQAGGFTLYNLPQGAYDIRCSSLQPFRRDAVIREIQVASGKQISLAPVTLEKEAKLTFRLDGLGLKIDGLDSTNPVIFDNELWTGVDNEYIWAKASTGDLVLRGNIVTQEFQTSQSNIDDQVVSGNHQLRLANLAGFTGIPAVVRGAATRLVLPPSGRFEDIVPEPSAGSDLIVKEARNASPEKPLLVLVGGPLTTVAQAYLTDPSIAARMVVAGVFSFNLQSSDSVANYLVSKKCRFVQWGRTYVWGGQRDSSRLREIPLSRMGERVRTFLGGTAKNVSFGDLAPVAYLFDRRLWKTAQMVKVSSTMEVQNASDITFDFLDIPQDANDWQGYENAFYAALTDPRAYHALPLPGRLEGEGFTGMSAGVSVIASDSATGGEEAVVLGVGAWTEYKISVATGSIHEFTLRYHSVAGAKIGLSLGSQVAGQGVPVELDLPASDDWNESVLDGLDLAPGTYTLRISGISGTCVLDWAAIAPAAP